MAIGHDPRDLGADVPGYADPRGGAPEVTPVVSSDPQARIVARAKAQPVPRSAQQLVAFFTSMVRQVGNGTTSTAHDVTMRALGLPYATACPAGDSRAGLLVRPDVGGAIRIGYDLPEEAGPAGLSCSPYWVAARDDGLTPGA